MEIKFKKLSMRNFLSYGNNLTTFEFSQPGTTLIVGENLDQTSQGNTSNGVGKTSTINALVYALYDKPLSDISKDNLINNINKKNMEVTVEFEIDNTSYMIKRERKAKNGNNVYFWINGEDKTRDSIANTNAAIEEAIGIQYDLFVQIVVFSTSHTPFLKLSKAEQTNMFERLVGLTMLTEKATNLKELIKDTDTNIKIKKSRIEVLEEEHVRYQTQLQHAKDRMDAWADTNITNIQNLTTQLESLIEPDYSKEQSLHTEYVTVSTQLQQETRVLDQLQTRKQEFNILQKQLADIGIIDFEKEQAIHEERGNINNQLIAEGKLLIQAANNSDELQKLKNTLVDLGDIDFANEEAIHIELNDLNKAIKAEELKLNEYTKSLSLQVQRRLKHLDELIHLKDNKCPYCSQLYADAGSKIADLDKEVSLLDSNIMDLQLEIDRSSTSLEANYTLNRSLSANITTHNLPALLRLKNEVDVLTNKITDLEKMDYDVYSHSVIINDLTARDESISKLVTTADLKELLKIKSDVERIKVKLESGTTIDSDIIEVKQSIELLKSTLDELSSHLTTSNLEELMTIKQKNDNIRVKLENFTCAINPHTDSYQELLNITLEEIDYEDINNLTRTIEHQKLLLKLLTKKDSFVRKALLQRYIPYINSRLKHYLSEMSLPHKVEFTPEMAAEISLMGRMLDFGQLSAGQQARVNLSLSLAFSDVLQKLHATVNIQLMDEILDTGLDNTNLGLAAKIIKARSIETDTSLYVISHRDEVISMFDNIMTIQMIKGFSYVKSVEGSDG
jgi:DNA repair exonuclease SbcCD ATPase subunit